MTFNKKNVILAVLIVATVITSIVILNNKETATKIKKLSGEEKIREVARISFGKITEVAIKYAYELQKEKFNI